MLAKTHILMLNIGLRRDHHCFTIENVEADLQMCVRSRQLLFKPYYSISLAELSCVIQTVLVKYIALI